MYKNVASQDAPSLLAWDTVNNVPKTGDAANILLYVSIDDAAPVLLGAAGAASEKDATNSEGEYYSTDGPTQAETNGDKLVFSGKSSTANIYLSPVTVYTRIGSNAGEVVLLADDAITASKFDETTAWPITAADTGATAVARTGADSDTLETISDEIAGLNNVQVSDLLSSGQALDTTLGVLDVVNLTNTATAVSNDVTVSGLTANAQTDVESAVWESAPGYLVANSVEIQVIKTNMDYHKLRVISGFPLADATTTITLSGGSSLLDADFLSPGQDIGAIDFEGTWTGGTLASNSDNLSLGVTGSATTGATLTADTVVAIDASNDGVNWGEVARINFKGTDLKQVDGYYVMYDGTLSYLSIGSQGDGWRWTGGGGETDKGADGKALLSTDAQTGVTIPTVTDVTNGSGDATEANQLLMMGAGFATGTDSLEAIRNRGDSAWVTGGTGGGATSHVYNVSDDDTSLPIAQALVWCTTDGAGSNTVGSGFTDDSGNITFFLDSGTTYYFWTKKSGWDFDNPDSETV